MQYDDLKKLIQPHLSVPVEDIYADFRTATGKDNGDLFLAYLQDRELIGNEAFRELHAQAQGVDLGPVGRDGSVGDTQGVMGATMMQGDQAAPRPLIAGLDETIAEVPVRDERPNYAMMGLLGEGSMGKIYLAKDLSLRRKVAFKELKAELAAVSPDIRERFINEAQITAQMDHPNVVPVYTIEVKEDQAAYAMKLIQGKTLKELITECKQIYDLGKEPDDDHTLSTRLEYFLRICDAMSYAHSKGVIHRDLKPANIMIGRYNEVYVMDWGIARMVQAIMQPEATTMIELARRDGHMPVIEPTQAGQAVGTPRYMSPEQAAGANMDLDERSDLYTLGTILFEMVILKPAITGNSLKEAMVNVMKGNIEHFEHYSPKEPVPRELKAIIEKSLNLDREKRYRSVKEFADDIRRYMRGDPVTVIPDQLMTRLQRWISRHRQATLMLVVALLILSATVLVWSLQREQQSRTQQVARTRALSRATAQAQAIDTDILRFQGLVEGIRAAALVALSHPAPAGTRHFSVGDFTSNTPDPLLELEPAPAYGGKPTSVTYPLLAVAPKVDAEQAEIKTQLLQLSSLRVDMARLLLRSKGLLPANDKDRALRAPAAGQQLGVTLREQGVPAARLFIALSSGVYASYPGIASLPPGFDARKTAWYKRSLVNADVQWGPPKIDGQGLGVVMTCTTAIVDTAGSVIGIVGLDVPTHHFVNRRMTPDTATGVQRTMIVDVEGKIVIDSRSDGRDKRGPGGRGDADLALGKAELAEAQALAKQGASNWAEAKGGTLLISCPLKSIAGTYIVVISSKPAP